MAELDPDRLRAAYEVAVAQWQQGDENLWPAIAHEYAKLGCDYHDWPLVDGWHVGPEDPEGIEGQQKVWCTA